MQTHAILTQQDTFTYVGYWLPCQPFLKLTRQNIDKNEAAADSRVVQPGAKRH
mgnify:CR=1 FL=1